MTPKQLKRRGQLREANRKCYRKRKNREQDLINKLETAVIEVMRKKLEENS